MKYKVRFLQMAISSDAACAANNVSPEKTAFLRNDVIFLHIIFSSYSTQALPLNMIIIFYNLITITLM